MLPDIPSLKRELLEFLQKYIRRRLAHHSPILGEVSRATIFEGDGGSRLARSDGTVEDAPLQSAEASVQFTAAEIPSLDLPALLMRADQVAAEFASQQSRHLFRSLEEVTDRTGNVVNVNGPPTPEALLEMIRTVEMEFDDSNRHHTSFVAPPELFQAANEAWTLMMEDPVYRARHDELMTQKREEYRAREATRKLVG